MKKALDLAQAGENASEIARRLKISRSTVRDWIAGSAPRSWYMPDGCPCCGRKHCFSELPPAYVYLLGMYLGDGYISARARGVYILRVSLDVRYPAIIEECTASIKEIVPTNRVCPVSRGSWIELCCSSKGWPCLFPQHGPGKKHERRIDLAKWQESLVARWPEYLLRGLIHSDGHRFQNTGRNNWSWPRYGFNNKSDDIRSIFCGACERLGVHWTAAGPYTIYVSRKADVATLDRFIGPKR